MPIMGGKKTSSKAVRNGILKRIVAVAFIAVATIFVLDQLGFHIDSSAQRAVRRIQRSRVGTDDCTFLKDPEQFRGVTQRHRVAVSRATEAVTENMETGASSLVSAGEISRKNFIDNILFDRMQAAGVGSAPLSTDAEFARRAYIDLTGRIPDPDVVANFLADQDPNKRDALIDRLVNSEEYVFKWTMFFNDLFKNTSVSSNITRYRGGRDAFYYYIRNSIAENKSYAQMATEVISATGANNENGAVNFLLGANVVGGPNQDDFDMDAVHATTTFLGLSSMDCLLCHNGAGHLDQINLWGAQVKRAEAWGMAAFFARVAIRQDPVTTGINKYTITNNTGEYLLNTTQGNRSARQPVNGNNIAAPVYMFGGGTPEGGERREAFARLMTADIQFARAAVNYVWEELMVEALVSPSNTFDLFRITPDAQLPEGWTMQATNPQLLQALAQDFIASGYNLRYLISTIAKSNAYQLSSKYPGEWKLELVPYYARKYARRLDSEELHDAIVKATNIPPFYTVNGVTTLGYQLVDEQNQKLRDVVWAMELPEPLEPRRNEGGGRVFLDSFLRGDRDIKLRTGEASILQSLNMMNHAFIMGKIGVNTRVLNVPEQSEIPSTARKLFLDTSLSNEQILEKLYLNTLSRYPADEEREKLMPYFTSLGKQAAIESIQWVLLNKVDFLYNY
jgi:Protein of unknown function (DUF1549)/Protein of unknown function (DUF1553)